MAIEFGERGKINTMKQTKRVTLDVNGAPQAPLLISSKKLHS